MDSGVLRLAIGEGDSNGCTWHPCPIEALLAFQWPVEGRLGTLVQEGSGRYRTFRRGTFLFARFSLRDADSFAFLHGFTKG